MGQRTPRGFRWGRFFRGSGVFSLFSLSLSSSSFFFSGGRPGCLFSSCAWFGCRTPAPSLVLPLSALSLFFFSLSLSSLSACIEKRYLAQITVNLVDPASSHMLVYKIKPGMPQRKRFPARLQTAHYDSNDFAALHHIWMTVENLGTILATSLTFGE